MITFWIISILFIIIYLLVLGYLVYMAYSMISGAPFVPTKMEKVKKMIEMSGLKKGQKMIDLGSGDGRIIIEASKTGAECTGVEISPFLYWWSKRKANLKGIKNVKFLRDTLWNVNLGEFDLITIYFIPHRMRKLHRKIKKEMKPGSRIVSYAFTFPDWKPIRKYDNIYLYEL